MKCRILAVFCLFALFCACTPVRTNQGTVWQMYGTTNATSAPDAMLQPRGDAKEMVFVISPDASDTLRAAATYFCKELEEISQGSIHMTVTESETPQTQLMDGTAQVALLDQKEQMSFSQPLQATASSFLYTGYRNFTMRANAPETLSLLERFLRREEDLVPLAAFYQGTRHFLTDFPVTNYLHWEGSTIAMEEDPELREALGRLGGQTVTASTLQERLKLFEEGEVTGLEIALEELATLSELPKASYLLFCGHNTVPVWMLARAEFWDSLLPPQQAGIHELCAYMINFIDDRQLESEEQLLDEISLSNLNYILEFSNVRNRVFNTLKPLSSDAPASEVVARDLVNMMRRIT
ncbi:MAG: hypothetical protein ACOX0K_07705 [Oscillospiraceae bacterium]|jgi:TRAP-type C4-dicarboxylate transport system substrate-binding protein